MSLHIVLTTLISFTLLPAVFAQSYSAQPYSFNFTQPLAPYPLPNTTAPYPTGTGASSGLLPTFSSITDTVPVSIVATSSSCNAPITVTETAIQTVYTTITPSAPDSTLAATSTVTDTFTQTLPSISGTGGLGGYGNGTATVAPSGYGTRKSRRGNGYIY